MSLKKSADFLDRLEVTTVLFLPLISHESFFNGSPSSPDKEAFARYLHDFNAVADPDDLLERLRTCDEPLPLRQMEALGLPVGSTYRDAVRLLLSSWHSAE